jgi:hypothetical protein
VFWLWGNLKSSRGARSVPQTKVHGTWWLWPAAMALLTTVIPSALVLNGAWAGLASLRQQPSFWRELTHGLAFAATSGGVAWMTARILLEKFAGAVAGRSNDVPLLDRPMREFPGALGTAAAVQALPGSRVASMIVGLLLLPGLSGSMTLALLVDDLFQQTWLRWAYDSPARMLTALTLSLLPRAVLVQTCVPTDRPTSERHAAALLQDGTNRQSHAGRELAWRLQGRPRFWGLLLVCSWGYLDLMIATISAPPGMEPVVKRLYNFMHFGHIAGLSAMVCVTVAAPLVTAGAVLAARRWWSGWNSA